jgi:hypothetical protein
LPQGTDKGHRSGGIAVNADGLHAALAHQRFQLLGRLVRIVNQGIGLAARYQRAIRSIPPVGEPLGDKPTPASTERLQTRLGQTDHRQAEQFRGSHEGPGVGIVTAGQVIQGPVRLDEAKMKADRSGQAGEGADLVNTLFKDLPFIEGQFTSAEILAIGKAGVSADAQAVLRRQSERLRRSRRSASMEAAGDICRGDQRNQFGVSTAAFAEIAIEVDERDGHDFSSLRILFAINSANKNPAAKAAGFFYSMSETDVTSPE